MFLGLKQYVPWWMKIGLKVGLKSLPIPYKYWRSLGLFQHGFMIDTEYALHVFRKHYDRARPYLPTPFVTLELGPGDSLASALIAMHFGSSHTYLVDAGLFATLEIAPYNQLSATLAQTFESKPPVYTSVEAMLTLTNTDYLTNGVTSLGTIPTNSVDLIFSQAVLEHVSLNEFGVTIKELYRIQRPGSIASHQIDLRDHLNNSLHSLRFSPRVWESQLFHKSGFYTNRLRASQIIALFTAAGYEILVCEPMRWGQLPLFRQQLHPVFRSFTNDDLATYDLYIMARKPSPN